MNPAPPEMTSLELIFYWPLLSKQPHLLDCTPPVRHTLLLGRSSDFIRLRNTFEIIYFQRAVTEALADCSRDIDLMCVDSDQLHVCSDAVRPFHQNALHWEAFYRTRGGLCQRQTGRDKEVKIHPPYRETVYICTGTCVSSQTSVFSQKFGNSSAEWTTWTCRARYVTSHLTALIYHLRRKDKREKQHKQSRVTSLASGVSMHRCDVTGPEKIRRLIMKKVTGDMLSLSFV